MASSAGAAAPSSTVGSQARNRPTGGAGASLQSEVLADAAARIGAEKPWYETLGLGWQGVADAGVDVAVDAVLAFNVVNGLIDAANETVLAPVFVVLKGLLGAVQGAAAAREEIVALIQYCVGISRCLLEASGARALPRSIEETLGEFEKEIEAVGRFVQTYGTRSGGCCGKMVYNSHDRDAAADHKRKLKDLLDAVMAGLALQTNAGVNDVIGMITARDPPRLLPLAEVPRGAPILLSTYVQRTAMLEVVVGDLTNPQRFPTATVCLLGMGGGGKTLMASSVVRDDRVRAIFKDGIFWIPVGLDGKDVLRLLEYLAFELARVRTDTPHSCPHRFESEEEVVRHLSAVREKNNLRCLVVLDNVWSVEVVNAFASTGFHVMVTTRQRTVISPAHTGLCAEVGNMSEEDALEVLRRGCGALGPLPAEAAREVACECGFLPLALGMAGAMAKEQPLDPSSWRAVREKLAKTHTKFLQMENRKLFSTVEASCSQLPPAQREKLQLMAVLASGALATTDMLASLWDQDVSDVPTGASVLVDRCLLQRMAGGYRLHDLMLEYLQLTIKMYGDSGLAQTAASRQAQYLGRLAVFNGYASLGEHASTGGYYSLIALWNSVKNLDGAVDAGACYAANLEGVDDMDTWGDVGWLLILLGNDRGAETVLREALRMAEGNGDDSTAIVGNLASALSDQGKFQEADLLHMRVIGILERALGADHPSLATSLTNRAIVLQEQGQFEEADLLLLRAIGIQERALGADHPSLALSLTNRANVLQAQGQFEEADLLLLRAIGIQERALGADHPSLAASIGSRANVLQEQGQLEEADLLYVRSIGIQERALGADHPSLAANLVNRAIVLQEQGKLEEADLLLLRAIGIQERALGADHPSLAISLFNRAEVLEAQGNLDQARSHFARALSIFRTKLGDAHGHTKLALEKLKDLDERQQVVEGHRRDTPGSE